VKDSTENNQIDAVTKQFVIETMKMTEPRMASLMTPELFEKEIVDQILNNEDAKAEAVNAAKRLTKAMETGEYSFDD